VLITVAGVALVVAFGLLSAALRRYRGRPEVSKLIDLDQVHPTDGLVTADQNLHPREEDR
jgi:hypothetical protein